MLGIQHFEQSAGRVAAEIAAQLIHLVQHEDRVVAAGAAQRLNDLPGKCPDVGAPVSANLRLVVHAAHGDAGELAPQGARDGAAQRRADETQDRSFEDRLQLQHGQVIQNAVFDLLQVVMIFVQNLGGAFDIHLRTRRDAPRQIGHPFEVGACHAVFRRRRGHARQPVEFAQRFDLDLFLHARAFQLLTQFLHVARRVVTFAEFLLDGLQLLAQIKLALVLGKLPLHLVLNARTEFDQFELAREVAVNLIEPRHAVEFFEQFLPLRMPECRQRTGHVIGKASGFGDVGGIDAELVREVRRGGNNLLEQADYVLPQGLDLSARRRLDVRQPVHLRAQEGLGRGEFRSADARNAFAEEQQVVLGDFDGLMHHAHRADLEEIVGGRRLDARIELRDDGKRPVLAERLHQGERGGAADRDRQQCPRVNHGVAYREHGEFFGCRVVSTGGRFVFFGHWR